MADAYKKISDFSQASSFGDNDLLLVSQSGTTKVIKGATLKEFAKAAGVEAAEINSATVNSTGHLILTTTTGDTIDTGKVTGEDGISVTGASIDAQYHLILTFSDGTTEDAGYCRGASGSGTGDMLKETYDADGAVEEAGGISTFFDNKYSDKYYDDRLMSEVEYDDNRTIAWCGGIETWARDIVCKEARDVSEPVGTIRTTVRKMGNGCWLECDGSEQYFGAAPILWQQMDGQLAFSQSSTTIMNYVSELSNIYWADAVKFDGNWWLAISGTSGSNAVLYIFRTAFATYYSNWSLAKTYTVSASAGTYPCTLGFGTDGESYDGVLMVVWTVGNTKVYYTTTADSSTWSEKTSHGLSGMSGHEVQMTASGDLTGFLMCDKTDCDLYLLNSVQGTFQTLVEDTEAFTGWTTTSISVSADDYEVFVARSMAKNSDSDTTITLYRTTDSDLSSATWKKIWGTSYYRYDNSLEAVELSNVCCPSGWGKCFLAFTSNNSAYIRIAVLDYGGEKITDYIVWVPQAANSAWPLKRPRLSYDYNAGVMLTYQCQKNSEASGAMFICCGQNEPFTEVSISNIPAAGAPDWFGGYIASNGTLVRADIYDETFTLPDISLGTGTKTYIKAKYEEQWSID